MRRAEFISNRVNESESGKQVKHPFNYKAVLDGKQDDIPLQPGDTIVVP